MSGLLSRAMPGAAPTDPLAGSVMSPGYIPQGSALNPLAGLLTGLAYVTRAGLLDPAQEGLNRLPTAGGALVRATLGKQPGPVKATMGLLGLGEAGGPGYEAGLAAGSAVGLLGGTDKAAEIAKQHAEQYRRYHAATTAPGAPATVWHGSPHKFQPTKNNPLGEFDSSKIGTGEGAQAYGHGLYLADKPGVASTYRWVDSHIDPDAVKYAGVKLETLYNRAQRAQDMAHRLPRGPAATAAINKANAELGFWESLMTRRHPKALIDDILDPDYGWPEQVEFVKKLKLEKFSGVDMNPGALYKVDLPDEAIAKMLDWDKPLSQQPAAVVDMVRDGLKKTGYLGPNDNGPRKLNSALRAWSIEHGSMSETGMQALLSGRGNLLGTTPENIAERLQQAGIPGIRYLDGGSRGAGSGTSNYVVFPGEEGLLKILSRE